MKLVANIVGALILGAILLAIVIPWLATENQATYTRVAVYEYGRLRAQAENGDISEAAACLKDVQAFWPPQILHDGKFAGIVASFRDSTVHEIITRMRSLSGENLGDDPEPWLNKYYKPRPNEGGPANRSQPVQPETDRTSAAAGSGR